MLIKKFKFLILLVFSFIFALQANAQTAKHPRVVEVEKYLTREALELLKSRFPDQSFMATVSIDAVHRNSSALAGESEKLPYMELDGEEIVDEWDDSSLSNVALLSRVKKVAVVLSLSDKLTEDEISEIKGALYSNLNLMEARDTIEIRKRNFVKPQPSFLEKNFSAFILLSSVLWAMLIIGFGGLFWFLSARIKNGLKSIKIQTVSSDQGANSASKALPQVDASNERISKSSQISGDLKFTDPFKVKEMLSSYVEKLDASSVFPNLDQMVAFDEFCQNTPGACGALLFEMPPQHMTTLFSYSTQDYWLKALNEPKELGSECLELLNKAIRLQSSTLPELEQVLILMWRLDKDKELIPFVKSLPQNEAFTLVDKLPAHLGLSVAREAFPGSWGILLNKSYSAVTFTKDRLEFLNAQLKQIKPLNPLSSIDKFKHDQDLVKYLLVADPQAEKEIYEAHEQPETLVRLRKPFYKVLESDDELKKGFVQKINIEDWAYAFFNLPRSERKGFEPFFSDKLKFRYLEILKQLDAKNPSKDVVGRTREKIAEYFYRYNENVLQMKLQQELEAKQKAEAAAQSEQTNVENENPSEEDAA